MSGTGFTVLPKSKQPHRLWLLIALFTAELVCLALAYQFFAQIECHATGLDGLCRGLRSLVARALAVFAVGALLLWARPALAQRLRAAIASTAPPRLWPWLHGLGVLVLLVPLIIARGAEMSGTFATMALFWGAGAALAAIGGLLWILPLPAWRRVAGPDLGVALIALGVAAVLPDLADLILPIWWHLPQLTTMTFHAVASVLRLTGGEVHVDPPGYIIGIGDFFVHIAQQCSGVEGLALVTGFTLIYAMLFHDQIRPLRYWLVVLPLGLMLSWSLNVLRIAILIVIGDRISPDLAVNGFHSYAGWLFFILLAFGLMWLVQAAPWLHRQGIKAPTHSLPLRDDWMAARILPFVVFMLGSTLAAAIFPHPELGYPLTAILMALALWTFWPVLRLRPWTPHPEAIAVGAVIGVVWVLSAPPADAAAVALSWQLGALGGFAFALWVGLRLLGTILLVPLIEELFFRGYLLNRLDQGTTLTRIMALTVSSALFGLLHDRWIEGAAAGLAFGILMLRRNALQDAVWAHIAANLVVALCAAARADWALI